MIPLCDVVPAPSRPAVTLSVVGLGLVGTVATRTFAGFEPTPTRDALAVFDHGSWPLLLATSLALWLFGPAVEDRLGGLRFAVLWLASAACGVLVVSLAGAPHAAIAPVAGTAGLIAAHVTTFPGATILAATPARHGWAIVEWQAPTVAAAWLGAMIASSVQLIPGPFATPAVALAPLAGGAVGWRAFRWLVRPDRLTITWWERHRSTRAPRP